MGKLKRIFKRIFFSIIFVFILIFITFSEYAVTALSGSFPIIGNIRGASPVYSVHKDVNFPPSSKENVATGNIIKGNDGTQSILPSYSFLAKADPILVEYLVNGSLSLEEEEKINVIVIFDGSPPDILSSYEEVRILKRYRIIPAVYVEVPLSSLEKITLDSRVKFVWLNREVSLPPIEKEQNITSSNFSSFQNETYVKEENSTEILLSDSTKIINASRVWNLGMNGSFIVIAIIDTGIDDTHPDLVGKVIDKVTFTYETNYPDGYDNHGHGTHCAGIAAGTGAASGGLYKGVAPGSLLMAVKVLTGGGWGYWDWVISGIEYAALGPDGVPDSGDEADVLSLSLGGWGYPGDPVSLAVDAAVELGKVVAVAAGNRGGWRSIISPGVAAKVITVGATDKWDQLAYFSSRGPTPDRRMDPDVLAPGVSITSSVPLWRENYYETWSGTSMATPHVAGAAALLLQAFPGASPEAIQAALMKTAVDLGLSPYEQGAGRIDVYSAFQLLNGTVVSTPLPSVETAGPSPRLLPPPLQTTVFEILFNSFTESRYFYHYPTRYDHMYYTTPGVRYDNTFYYLRSFRVIYPLTLVVNTSDTKILESVLQSPDDALTLKILIEVPGAEAKWFRVWYLFEATRAVTNLKFYVYADADMWGSGSDFANYTATQDAVFMYDRYNGNPHLGFSGFLPSFAHDVGYYWEVYDRVRRDELNNLDGWGPGDSAMAMAWGNVSLASMDSVNFTVVWAFGDDAADFYSQISNAKTAPVPAFNFTNIVVTQLERKGRAEIGETVTVNAIIMNLGFTDVKDLEIQFIVDGVLNDSKFIPSLGVGDLITVDFNTAFAAYGLYNVTVNALPPLGESYVTDNMMWGFVLVRDVLTGPLPSLVHMFPSEVPAPPFRNSFPLNLLPKGFWINVTVLSSSPVNATFVVTGNASLIVSVTPSFIYNFSGFSFLNLSLSFPEGLNETGPYLGEVQLMVSNVTLSSLDFNFTVLPPAPGRFIEGPVAIFKYNDPWDGLQVEAILDLYGIEYDVYSMYDFLYVNLTAYEKVIIPSDQYYWFYQELAKPTVLCWFEDYVARGGILEIHACDMGWHSWRPWKEMPGAFSHITEYRNDIQIEVSDHQVLVSPWNVTFDSLQGWYWSTHGYLTNLPSNVNNLLITDNNPSKPVLSEFRLGLGWIITSMMTLEWGYHRRDSLLLENLMLYAPAPSTGPVKELGIYGMLPTWTFPGSVNLDITAANLGTETENVTIDLIVEGTVLDTKSIILSPASSASLSFNFHAGTYGVFNVTIYAHVLLNETVINNNRRTQILTVTQLSGAKILIDRTISTYGSIGWEFIDELRARNATVDIKYSGGYTLKLLQNYDVIVFTQPREYNSTLGELIRQYVISGGNLLFFGDDWPDIFTQYTSFAGINWTVGGWWGVTYDITVHPITKYVRQIYFPAPVCSLEVSPPAITLIRDRGGYNATAISEIGAGKVVAIHDEQPFVWGGIWVADNHLLVSNIFEYLVGVVYEHDLMVDLEAPDFLAPNDSSLLNATVYNIGLNDEANVTFKLLINGSIVNSTVIPLLRNGSSIRLTYLWTPTAEGIYNVTAYAPPVPGENVTANNIATKIVRVRQIRGYVLYDQTHGTDSIEWYNIWVANLTDRGYIVVTHISGPITSSVLAGYDIFVIPQARDTYSPSELSAIQGFVSSGGGLLVIGDDAPSVYTDLTGFAGITWISGGRGGTTTDITPHEVTEGVTSVYLPAPVAQMQVTAPAIDLIRDPVGGIMLAVSEMSGRVVGFADEGSLRDRGITSADNMRLANNMIDWLMGVQYEHELAVHLEAPIFLVPGDSSLLNATVYNRGLSNETDVDLFLLINGTIVNSTTIPLLMNGSSYTINYLWTPTVEGTYNVTAYAPPVPGENKTYNNQATIFVIVTYPLIHPIEGQWTNYTILRFNITTGEIIRRLEYNVTYDHYVSPYLINITIWIKQTYPEPEWNRTYWYVVNTINRLIENSTWGPLPFPFYWWGWIETNITLGSIVNILTTKATVVGSRIIEVAGNPVDCWELLQQYDAANETWWHDKTSGLLVGWDYVSPYYHSNATLVATNVIPGRLFEVHTDKPMYTRGEIVNLTATYTEYGVGIENATVLFQVNYPNNTIYFTWAEKTDGNGVATILFLIDSDAPFGNYTVYATAYKPGTENVTATTWFMVVYLEPSLQLWFDGPNASLIGQESVMSLHILNAGNGTAYNVNVTLHLPEGLTIISANTSYAEPIEAGEEVLLVAVVVSDKPPYKYIFTANATYTKVDGTPLPPVSAEAVLVYAYHLDYLVDLINITITTTPGKIIVNLTITNYGDLNVNVTLIASAQHIATKLVLKSTYTSITIQGGETITVSLEINVPATAPSGEYRVQGILATGLPENKGFTLTYREETVTV